MGGKRRDYDGSFAMLDINFILDDPRLDSLTAADRWVYLTLWCIAVRERSEVLPTRYRLASVARLARVQPSTAKRALKKIMQNCLIEIDSENTITVLGVRGKHKNLKWKDDPINENIGGNKNPKVDNKNKKKNTEEEEERKTPKPPKGAAVSLLEKYKIELPQHLDNPAFRKTWGEWEQYRKDMKKKMPESTVQRQIKKLTGFTSAEAITMLGDAIEKGWVGFREDSLKTTGKPSPKEEHLNFINDPILVPDDWKDRK